MTTSGGDLCKSHIATLPACSMSSQDAPGKIARLRFKILSKQMSLTSYLITVNYTFLFNKDIKTKKNINKSANIATTTYCHSLNMIHHINIIQNSIKDFLAI